MNHFFKNQIVGQSVPFMRREGGEGRGGGWVWKTDILIRHIMKKKHSSLLMLLQRYQITSKFGHTNIKMK